jgi:hypothetical protein
LLPTDKYAPGRTLPPHLSPFVEEKIGEYVPLEKIEQLKEDGKGEIFQRGIFVGLFTTKKRVLFQKILRNTAQNCFS